MGTSQLVTSTTRDSREISAAQDARGEEKVEPQATGRTTKGSETAAEFKCGEVLMVQWDGRSRAPVVISEHQQTTGSVAGPASEVLEIWLVGHPFIKWSCLQAQSRAVME
ncbi:hypothetical protein NDU88_009910 [Pleurodeles waltl]|uniref:Uncharacterized protein n=1 Tax=Pleurodeles waltl TaxID=8319 RepID=A0AAV7S0D0_PLEWA|nr:hypothetical protein NDU88_009910 [Pleurodeles waltl]